MPCSEGEKRAKSGWISMDFRSFEPLVGMTNRKNQGLYQEVIVGNLDDYW
jgi:hypothetical protein